MTDIVPEDAAANLTAEGGSYGWDLPEPWIFDGTRRLYRNGQPSGWVARAVDLSGQQQPRGLDNRAPLTTAEGDTPMNATIALVEKLAAD